MFVKYTVARKEQEALVKSTTKIFSNFVAFSENPHFTFMHLNENMSNTENFQILDKNGTKYIFQVSFLET
jgi:hypothetical protein